MLNTEFSPWPCYTDEEVSAVEKVLLSNKVNYWTGTEVQNFEKDFAYWCGATHAIALANGTLALELALRALNIGSGDEVIVTPRTFIASISCIVNVGAIPVFADVELNSGNISAETIRAVITPRTKAVICVHLAGWPCDMDSIMRLAQINNIKVIEDCAQAHGAMYKGKSVGTIGHVGAWSFCQDKIISTGGEGGMVTTNDESLWRTMWSIKDHGKSFDVAHGRSPNASGFRWLHESFGTNMRMTEMQAAIGRIQLGRMQEWSGKRRKNALLILNTCRKFPAFYSPIFSCNQCETCNCETFDNVLGCKHAFYKCYVYVRPNALANGWTRDRIIDAISSEGVPCYQGSCSEVYLEKAFDNKEWRPILPLLNAKTLGETSLMFLVHPNLTDAEIQKTCKVIKQVMSSACVEQR